VQTNLSVKPKGNVVPVSAFLVTFCLSFFSMLITELCVNHDELRV